MLLCVIQLSIRDICFRSLQKNYRRLRRVAPQRCDGTPYNDPLNQAVFFKKKKNLNYTHTYI